MRSSSDVEYQPPFTPHPLGSSSESKIGGLSHHDALGSLKSIITYLQIVTGHVDNDMYSEATCCRRALTRNS